MKLHYEILQDLIGYIASGVEVGVVVSAPNIEELDTKFIDAAKGYIEAFGIENPTNIRTVEFDIKEEKKPQ
jgi:hypothetical protein